MEVPWTIPHSHLASFVEICDTFKANGVSEEVVRLKLFRFSLRDKAKNWLDAQPSGSITTWEDLAKKFLSKFFPPGKTAKLRSEINNFYQQDGESLSEAWERFKELIRRCPHHNIVKWMLVQNFFNGLDAASNTLINAASGGAFLKRIKRKLGNCWKRWLRQILNGIMREERQRKEENMMCHKLT